MHTLDGARQRSVAPEHAAALAMVAGVWALEEGELALAAEHFEEASTVDDLSGPALRKLAEALSRQGQTGAALTALSSVPPESSESSAAKLDAANILRRKGRFDAALSAAREAWQQARSEVERSTAKLLEADILFASGERKAATAVVEGMWWRDEARADAAFSRLRAWKQAPDATDLLLFELVHQARHSAEKDAKALRRQVKRLRGVRGLEPLAEALILRHLRRHKADAADAAEVALASLSPRDRLYPWALWAFAETVRKLDRDVEAAGAYAKLASQFPKHPFAPVALFEAGQLLCRAGRVAEGEAHLRRLLEQYPGVDESVEALWELGWAAYLGRDSVRAEQIFTQILRGYSTRRTRARAFYGEVALYWLGRSYEDQGHTDRAAHTYAELTERYPLTYYATLAQGRRDGLLGTQHPPRPPGEEAACSDKMAFPLRAAIEPHEDLDTAVALLRLGLHDESWQELSSHLDSGTLPQDGLLLMLGLCRLREKDGCTEKLLRSYGRIGPLPNAETLPLWQEAFPVRYVELVEQYAADNHLPPNLVLALMRHESGFNPRTVSYAGAYGLMQILPSVASEVSGRLLRQGVPKKRELLDPEVNIRLGSRFLRELVRLFQGNLALALASYNAGHGAVKQWLERYGHLDSDEFVEVMPYKGAKAYAQKVLTTFAVYQYLYCETEPGGAPAFTLPEALPSELGEFMAPE
jgi:soluble lytic murein transglycosylase